MTKELLYEGKAKKIFSTEKENIVLMEFKNSLTAFNALKKGSFEGKGELNCKISTLIFKVLSQHNISHHWIETQNDVFMYVQKTKIIPLEVVIRNYVAGSLAKKLNLTEGDQLSKPILEFYYKDDKLNDPFVNNDQILAFSWATGEQISIIRDEAFKINSVLVKLFNSIGLKLIDFKVEFGINSEGKIVLADEISPDCMRIWDQVTNKKLDKDRFRQDLGQVDEAYKEIFDRLSKGVNV